MNKKRVLILGFGGTIAMVADAESGVLKPAKSIDEIEASMPSIADRIDATVLQLENKDSTNINPSHWTKLAMKIAEICTGGEYDGIIVTHGTDTMAYTAGAVSLALGPKLPIPVAFTGSQLPLVAWRTDARFNLENAIETIVCASEQNIREVMIVFNERVLRAARTIKTSESRFIAFDSPAFPYLSTITLGSIAFDPQAIRGDAARLDLSLAKFDHSISPHFQRGILSVEIVPGIEPGISMEVLRSGKCQGLLLKSLGSGNVPSEDEYSLIPVIEAATQKFNIPVLVSTKFVGGNTHMETYEPGKLALDAGGIPTGDMTDVMAQVKFMWALAQGHRESDVLRKVMAKSFVGEISEG